MDGPVASHPFIGSLSEIRAASCAAGESGSGWDVQTGKNSPLGSPFSLDRHHSRPTRPHPDLSWCWKEHGICFGWYLPKVTWKESRLPSLRHQPSLLAPAAPHLTADWNAATARVDFLNGRQRGSFSRRKLQLFLI